MKKTLSFILVSVMLLSAFVFPISATPTEEPTPVVATNVSAKTVTVDGIKNDEAEGYSSEPVAYLNQTFGTVSPAAADSKYGEVYVSYNDTSVYVFVEVYNSATYDIKNNAFKTPFISVAFGDEKSEVRFWGPNPAENATDKRTSGCKLGMARNDNSVTGYSYYIEVEYEIPTALRDTLKSSGLEIHVRVTQNLGASPVSGGAYIGAEANPSANEDFARNNAASGIKVNLPATVSADDELAKENLKQWLTDSKTNANFANLTGLSVNVLGDSYFTGGALDSAFTWSSMMETKYGWTLNDYAVNGNMVSTYGDIDALPMVKRYRQLPSNDPDLVIVTGGYNDFKNNVPLGESGSTDQKTYIGALNTLLKGLKSKYKDSAIVFVTPWNFTGTNSASLTYQDYVNAMVEACEANGIYCFKGYDSAVSGVDMQSEAFRTQYCVDPADSYHLNLEGMKLVFPKVEAALDAAIAQWLEGDTSTEEEKSENTQTGDTDEAGEADNSTAETEGEESSEEEKRGCGSFVGIAPILMLAVAAVAVLAAPKKKKE